MISYDTLMMLFFIVVGILALLGLCCAIRWATTGQVCKKKDKQCECCAEYQEEK